MIHDPSFADAVYDNPTGTLSGLGLTDAQRAMLVRPDPRRYRIDTMRSARVLAAMLEEFKVSAAIVTLSDDGVGSLRQFFETDYFHEAIQGRASLAPAFAGYLRQRATETQARAWACAVTDLEEAIALVRRAHPDEAPVHGPVTLAANTRILEVPEATLAIHCAITEALSRLGEGTAISALLHPNLRVAPLLSAMGDAREFLLVEGTEDGPAISYLTPELFALLRTANDGVSREALHQTIVSMGADDRTAVSLVTEFIDDGVLVVTSR